MKYLGLAYYSPERFTAMSPEAVDALVSQCPALYEKMRATGKVLVSEASGSGTFLLGGGSETSDHFQGDLRRRLSRLATCAPS